MDLELEELLGTGGFGEVWKARNPHFDGVAPVALKFCLDPKAKDRLLKHEAEVVNRVGKHPGIVPLLDTYLSADPPCLKYEYVSGGDLTALIRTHGAVGPTKAAHYMLQLANIVGFAHGLKIIHRDLKPANILVQSREDGDFHLRVTDFGIGQFAAREAIEHTRHGVTTGQQLVSVVRGAYTRLYASPEQIDGKMPDPRDDVHALGIIRFQLQTGLLALMNMPNDSARRTGCRKHAGAAARPVGVVHRKASSPPSRR